MASDVAAATGSLCGIVAFLHPLPDCVSSCLCLSLFAMSCLRVAPAFSASTSVPGHVSFPGVSAEDDFVELEISVEGMMCDGCSSRIEASLNVSCFCHSRCLSSQFTTVSHRGLQCGLQNNATRTIAMPMLKSTCCTKNFRWRCHHHYSHRLIISSRPACRLVEPP